MQIIIEPLVTQKQVALIEVLLSKGYFATEAAAFAYADAISDFINTLPRQTAQKRKIPATETITLPTKPTAALPGTFCLI